MSKPNRPTAKVKPSADDGAGELAARRGLPLPAIRAAMGENVLAFRMYLGLPAWFFQDASAGCTRRLDGELWNFHNGEKAKVSDVGGTSGERLKGWPIGLLNVRERQTVIVCEGAPDALAAYAVSEQTRGDFAIVAILGSGLTICADALPHFAGKRVRFIAHADTDGLEFAERNARLLVGNTEEVSIATLDGIRRADGNAATDLCEAVAFRKQGNVPDEITRLFDFEGVPPGVCVVTGESASSASSACQSEFVTQDNSGQHRDNTGEHNRWGERGLECLYGKARELACTARHQTTGKLFELVRWTCAYETDRGGEDRSLRKSVFETWHLASKPNLDPKESRTEYRARFLSMFRKVRIIPGQRDALTEAEGRAKSAALPDIPDEPEAPESLRRVAAVCRELQRIAGDAPFFISMRCAARIAGGQKDAPTGSRILRALEEFGVLKCVRRGEAKPGGKASEYRYLLPC